MALPHHAIQQQSQSCWLPTTWHLVTIAFGWRRRNSKVKQSLLSFKIISSMYWKYLYVIRRWWNQLSCSGISICMVFFPIFVLHTIPSFQYFLLGLLDAIIFCILRGFPIGHFRQRNKIYQYDIFFFELPLVVRTSYSGLSISMFYDS